MRLPVACAVAAVAMLLAVPNSSARRLDRPAPGHALVSVPMLFRGSMPAVEVFVNNQGPFLFAIDTGGQGMARVDSSLREKLKLETVDTVGAADGSGRDPVPVPVVRVDSIRLGKLEFKDVRALSRDYNRSPNAPRIDGILGFNLFADYLLTLDFPGKTVRLELGALPTPDGTAILGFEAPRGIPVVRLDVCGHAVTAHLDSGNMVGGFMLPESLAEQLTFVAPPTTVGVARTVSGETEIKAGQVRGTIRLGGFAFVDPAVTFPAVSADGNIGAAVMQEFAITFDQKNSRVRLERGEAATAIAPPAGRDTASADGYTGRYGERTISERGADLFLQRTGGPALKMLRADKDEFTLDGIPQARVVFVRDESGSVVELQVLNRDGVWEKARKEAP